MSDITFSVILVTTLLGGYYRRDEKNEEYLKRYNDEFPDKERVQAELDTVFDFIDGCDLPAKSRAWKHTDLFTLLVELHSVLITRHVQLVPGVTGNVLAAFYQQVQVVYKDPNAVHDPALPVGKEEVARYLKGAIKATNDKYSRIDRAEVLSIVIDSTILQEGKPQPKRRHASARKGRKE